MTEIDGSFGKGGGQVFRTAASPAFYKDRFILSI